MFTQSSRIDTAVAVFAPNLETVASNVIVPGITEVVTARFLPTTASTEARKALMLVMAILATSSTDNKALWKSYLVTYILIAYPSLATDKDVARAVSIQQITDEEMVGLNAAGALLKDIIREEEVSKTLGRRILRQAKKLFPQYDVALSENDLEDLADSQDIRAMYGHVSLVIFLAAKVITDQNRNSITSARPKALISKYRMPANENGELTILNGTAKMSNEAHNGINRAWLEMSGFRIPALTQIIRGAVLGADISHDVVHTTVRLLAFSLMSHAVFCRDLITTYDWVQDYDPLRSSISIFVSSANALAKVDPVLRPYVKVIYQDRASFFPRRDMLPLVACAVAVKQEDGGSMMNYATDAQFSGVVAAFRAKRAEVEKKADGAQLTAPLPPPPEVLQGEDSAAVLEPGVPSAGPPRTEPLPPRPDSPGV